MAPQSINNTESPILAKFGRAAIKAGRSTPFIRPTTSKPAVNKAPVLPAEIKASASPFRTARAAITIDDSRFVRTALTGSSSDNILSAA